MKAISRAQRFAMAVLCGYGSLAANMVFILASVPLALRYLPREAFGLWALTAQVMAFIQLLDIGMSGAAFRILIDYKDEPEQGPYGQMLKTSALMFAVQATAMVAVSSVLAPMLPRLLHVPGALQGTFSWLLLGTCMAFAGTYAFSVFTQVLFAAQRQDIISMAASVGFVVQFGVMWLGFRIGWGIWSMLAGYGASRIWILLFSAVSACRLRLISWRWLQQPVRRKHLAEVFHYGKDRFFVIIGQQVILGAPAFLVTRFLGLEAMAAWKVGTQVLILFERALSSIQDAAYPALVEMHVRGEADRLQMRFRSLTRVCFLLAAPAAVGIASLNSSFVRIWTSGRLAWGSHLDLLLAAWLLLSLSVRCHWTTTGLEKRMGGMRVIYFAEAALLILGSIIGIRAGLGLSAVLMAMVAARLIFSFPYTLSRTASFFSLSFADVALRWMRPAFLTLVPLGAVALLAGMLAGGLQDLPRFIVSGSSLVAVSLLLLLLHSDIQLAIADARNLVTRTSGSMDSEALNEP